MTVVTETHPYNLREVIPDETRLLIVGTAPPPWFSNPACIGKRGRRDFNFFYGSDKNFMWKKLLNNIAEEIDGEKLFADDASSDDRYSAAHTFLQDHKMWMRDVLQTYHRKNECSSFDRDIEPEQLTDFRPIFNLPKLSAIAFTSEQAAKWTFEGLEKQGLTTVEVYKDELARWKNIQIAEATRESDIRKKFEQPFLKALIGLRETKFYILPTPTGRSRIGLKMHDKQTVYKNVLITQLHLEL
jgi:G:T/U-mismatch repair DNA glycosylase